MTLNRVVAVILRYFTDLAFEHLRHDLKLDP